MDCMIRLGEGEYPGSYGVVLAMADKSDACQ